VDWAVLGLVTLMAAAVQGAIGFAFSLLTVAFFLLILQSTEAVQVTLILNLVICGSLCRHLWKGVPFRLWRLLLLGALVGVPVGAFAFAYASLATIYVAVAVVILVFTVVLALQKTPEVVAESTGTSTPYRPPSVVGVGFAAGVMTAAISMPGPVLVLYLTAVGVDKATFRAVSLTLFTVLYGGAILVQSFTLGIERPVWLIAAALLPLAWMGAALGHRLAGHINEVMFRRVVLILLAATGSYMLITTLLG
jgi:uncharacterized membrane protein YfcA